jgi:hypothetical protein
MRMRILGCTNIDGPVDTELDILMRFPSTKSMDRFLLHACVSDPRDQFLQQLRQDEVHGNYYVTSFFSSYVLPESKYLLQSTCWLS